ncbi:MAG: hypothetical protein AAFY71_10660 [Bacteroidota bacterium]
MLDLLGAIDLNKQRIDEKARIQNIILFSDLLNPANRRPTKGKKITEIESDSDYYFEVARRAQNLMDKLKPSFFERIWMKIK